MAVRRYNFRLYPGKQAEAKMFGARRLHAYLYNACLDHRISEYRHFGRSVFYIDQQAALVPFKDVWPEYWALNHGSLQATVKRVDLAFNAFFKGLRKYPRFKSIRYYSGWTYPDARQGFKVTTQDGLNGHLKLNDLDVEIPMRGKAKVWGIPSTCTIVYKSSKRQWFASFTVNVPEPETTATLETGKALAFDLGTKTALTTFNGEEFDHIDNPRYVGQVKDQIRTAEKQKRRKRAPNRKKGVKASNRWKKAQKRVNRLKHKAANQRQNWIHNITTDIARRYDIVVTEKLNVKSMTRQGKKRKKQKAGLNKAILDVGFGMLRQAIVYKVTANGGLVLELPTGQVKPSQRCPQCGKVNKDWAELSDRYHYCQCGYEGDRDESSALVMWKWLYGTLPGHGDGLVKRGCSSATSKTRKHTGSMKQLGQMKRQKSQPEDGEDAETPSLFRAG